MMERCKDLKMVKIDGCRGRRSAPLTAEFFTWPLSPFPELANYGEKVGATTPVGRYPEGATPEGLLDMAGNVWEWMANFYREDKDWPALRGGSWDDHEGNLRCSARVFVDPDCWNGVIGFRVVRPQS